MKKMEEYKQCSLCETYKHIDEFYAQKKFNKKRGNYIYYFPECKSCTKERSTKWRKKEENRESYLESQKKRNKRFTKEMRANAKRRSLNGEHKKWMRLNKDKAKKYNRFRAMNKSHDITHEEWEECKIYFDYSCAYCGIHEVEAKQSLGNVLHKEHVEHTGSNKIDNCVPACKSCNSKKWTFTLTEWYNIDNEVYDKDREKKIYKWLDRFK